MDTLDNERRIDSRLNFPADWNIHVIKPTAIQSIDGVNVSNRGACLRVGHSLEINSLMDLQFKHMVSAQAENVNEIEKCSARVAWVVQRLDLRATPPFLFDVGIEWLSPPKLLIQSIFGKTAVVKSELSAKARKALTSWQRNGREFVPKLTFEENRDPSWHLVIMADGAPCSSQRLATEKAALEALKKFQEDQAPSGED